VQSVILLEELLINTTTVPLLGPVRILVRIGHKHLCVS
jgi:hypothetical protein